MHMLCKAHKNIEHSFMSSLKAPCTDFCFSEGDKSLMIILESWENSAPIKYLT